MEDPTSSNSNSDSNDFNFPSGVQLPFALRRKVEEQQQKQQAQTDNDDVDADEQQPKNKSAVEANDYKFLTAVQSPVIVEMSDDQRDASFSAEDLEKRIWRATVAMVEVQKQVQRGEETYYDETFNHGNIFKGWEGILDAKDVGSSDGIGMGGRKVPADYRWFSNSCKSIPRNPRPSPITVNAPTLTATGGASASQYHPPRSTTSGVTPMSTISEAAATNAPAVADGATSSIVTGQSASGSAGGLATNATTAELSTMASTSGDKGGAASTLATAEAVGTKRPAEMVLDQKIPNKTKTEDESQPNANAESGAAEDAAKEGPTGGTKVESQRPTTPAQSEQPSTGKKQRGRKRKMPTNI